MNAKQFLFGLAIIWCPIWLISFRKENVNIVLKYKTNRGSFENISLQAENPKSNKIGDHGVDTWL